MSGRSLLRRLSRSRIWRYWGLVLVAIMVIFLGGLQAAAYVVMTLLVIVWALFSAPTWCGAVNRQRGGKSSIAAIVPPAYCSDVGFVSTSFNISQVDHQLAGSDARNLGGRAGKACNYFSRVRHYHWNNRRNG